MQEFKEGQRVRVVGVLNKEGSYKIGDIGIWETGYPSGCIQPTHECRRDTWIMSKDWYKWEAVMRTMDDLRVGDVIKKDGDSYEVLARLENIIFHAKVGSLAPVRCPKTIESLKQNGYTLVQDTPDEDVTVTISRKSAEALGLI